MPLEGITTAQLLELGGLKARCSAALRCVAHGLNLPCDICAVESDDATGVVCIACNQQFPQGLLQTSDRPCQSVRAFETNGHVAFREDAETQVRRREIERQRLEDERVRQEAERARQEEERRRLEAERLEHERRERETRTRLEGERIERERLETQRREHAERERLAAEQRAREEAERERLAREEAVRLHCDREAARAAAVREAIVQTRLAMASLGIAVLAVILSGTCTALWIHSKATVTGLTWLFQAGSLALHGISVALLVRFFKKLDDDCKFRAIAPIGWFGIAACIPSTLAAPTLMLLAAYGGAPPKGAAGYLISLVSVIVTLVGASTALHVGAAYTMRGTWPSILATGLWGSSRIWARIGLVWLPLSYALCLLIANELGAAAFRKQQRQENRASQVTTQPPASDSTLKTTAPT